MNARHGDRCFVSVLKSGLVYQEKCEKSENLWIIYCVAEDFATLLIR